MNEIQLTPLSSEFVPRAIALYEQAFPESERRPVAEWQRLMREDDNFHIYRISTPVCDFCGFISCWLFDGFSYIEHFAIEPSRRGGGLGGKALVMTFKNLPPKPVILEVEPPAEPMALRRVMFYRRNGMELLQRTYIQPPYTPGLPPLPLYLMSTDPAYATENFDPIVQTLYTKVYGADAESMHPYYQ